MIMYVCACVCACVHENAHQLAQINKQIYGRNLMKKMKRKTELTLENQHYCSGTKTSN